MAKNSGGKLVSHTLCIIGSSKMFTVTSLGYPKIAAKVTDQGVSRRQVFNFLNQASQLLATASS